MSHGFSPFLHKKKYYRSLKASYSIMQQYQHLLTEKVISILCPELFYVITSL